MNKLSVSNLSVSHSDILHHQASKGSLQLPWSCLGWNLPSVRDKKNQGICLS